MMQSVSSDERPTSDRSSSEVTGSDIYSAFQSSTSPLYDYDMDPDNDYTPSNPPKGRRHSKPESPYMEKRVSTKNNQTMKPAQRQEQTKQHPTGSKHRRQRAYSTSKRDTGLGRSHSSTSNPGSASHRLTSDSEDSFDDKYDEPDAEEVRIDSPWAFQTATGTQYSGNAGNTYYQTTRRMLRNATVRNPYVKPYLDYLDNAPVQQAKRIINTTTVMAAKVVSKHATAAIGAIGNAADSFVAANEIRQYRLVGNDTYDARGEDFVAVDRAGESRSPGRPRDRRSKEERLAEHFGVSVVHTTHRIMRSEEEQIELLEGRQKLRKWKAETGEKIQSGVAQGTFDDMGIESEG